MTIKEFRKEFIKNGGINKDVVAYDLSNIEAFILKALDLARSAGKLKGYAQCRRDYEAIRMPDASLAKEGSKE